MQGSHGKSGRIWNSLALRFTLEADLQGFSATIGPHSEEKLLGIESKKLSRIEKMKSSRIETIETEKRRSRKKVEERTEPGTAKKQATMLLSIIIKKQKKGC